MTIIEKSDSDLLRYYTERLAERVEKENLIREQEKALEGEKTRSAFKKAASLFSFPFKSDAFGALLTAILTLYMTIIFAGCAIFVIIAVVFCALVDFLYIILFGLFYPFALLYFAAFKPLRIRRLGKKLEKTNNSLAHMISKKELEDKIAELKRNMPETKSVYTSNPGVEETEWYKEKSDEYYRMYMGFPPKEESSLSSLSTDATLDMHPGDY